jgi:hypothetical protein
MLGTLVPTVSSADEDQQLAELLEQLNGSDLE